MRGKGGFSIVDEIYQGLSYDAEPFSALSLADHIIVINSFSKYFNMIGWRLGWLVLPEALVSPIEKLAQNLFICPSSIVQHAALACFEQDSLAVYQGAQGVIQAAPRLPGVPQLIALGFKVPVIPGGAFYVYADCSGLLKDGGDADSLVKDILNRGGVSMVSGLDFGAHTARHYVRLSYVTSMENLQEAMRRLGSYFGSI